jgi:chemotaxis protein MotB
MNRLAVMLTIVLVPAFLATVGCQNQAQKDLAGLTQRYNKLSEANKALQEDLQASNAENGRLMAQLNDREAKLLAARAESADLKKRPALPPPGPVSAKFTLASDIVFAPGKATLSRQGSAKLQEIARMIKGKYPNDTVRVYGYTDSDPIKKSAKYWQDNLDLSANRAMAVTRRLQKLGISAESIETIGMGASRFVAPNTSRAGKAKNRRVEIVMVQQK